MKKTFAFFLGAFFLVAVMSCKKEDPGTGGQPQDTTKKDTSAKEEIIELTTSYGTMYIWLNKETPKHRENYLKLAKQGYFDSITFHRIIQGFMIQGGDPNSKDSDPANDGQGGPGYTIPAEFVSSLKHIRGSIGAARTNNPQKESSGSQFYISLTPTGCKHLDGSYTVFGFVMKGMEAADKIVQQQKDVNDRPLTDIKMSMKVIVKTRNEIKSEYDFTAN